MNGNYIVNTYNENKIVLTDKTVDLLKKYRPKDCPFSEYTLFDLLIDFAKMYSWKMYGRKSIKEFIEALQKEGIQKAIIYGNCIAECCE